MESIWFKHPILHLCPQVVFPSQFFFSHELLFKLAEKKKQVYVLPKLGDYIFATSFDLWVSKGAHDIFAFVISFQGYDWEPKQVIIKLFETTKTIG